MTYVLYPREYFEAVSALRGTTGDDNGGGGTVMDGPDVRHDGATWALADAIGLCGSAVESILAQRERLANVLTLIGVGVLEADDVEFDVEE